jgi:hypothetical protein
MFTLKTFVQKYWKALLLMVVLTVVAWLTASQTTLFKGSVVFSFTVPSNAVLGLRVDFTNKVPDLMVTVQNGVATFVQDEWGFEKPFNDLSFAATSAPQFISFVHPADVPSGKPITVSFAGLMVQTYGASTVSNTFQSGEYTVTFEAPAGSAEILSPTIKITSESSTAFSVTAYTGSIPEEGVIAIAPGTYSLEVVAPTGFVFEPAPTWNKPFAAPTTTPTALTPSGDGSGASGGGIPIGTGDTVVANGTMVKRQSGAVVLKVPFNFVIRGDVVAGCGDGNVVAPETCDPPGSPVNIPGAGIAICNASCQAQGVIIPITLLGNFGYVPATTDASVGGCSGACSKVCVIKAAPVTLVANPNGTTSEMREFWLEPESATYTVTASVGTIAQKTMTDDNGVSRTYYEHTKPVSQAMGRSVYPPYDTKGVVITVNGNQRLELGVPLLLDVSWDQIDAKDLSMIVKFLISNNVLTKVQAIAVFVSSL